jgi:hypothetical protein
MAFSPGGSGYHLISKSKNWGAPRVVEVFRQPGQGLGISIVGGKVGSTIGLWDSVFDSGCCYCKSSNAALTVKRSSAIDTCFNHCVRQSLITDFLLGTLA